MQLLLPCTRTCQLSTGSQGADRPGRPKTPSLFFLSPLPCDYDFCLNLITQVGSLVFCIPGLRYALLPTFWPLKVNMLPSLDTSLLAVKS